MHFVPIFLSDHEFFRRTSQKLSLWWVDLLSVILNLTNSALDDIRVNFFGRQLIGRKTLYSGQKNDFFTQDFSLAGGIIEPSWKSSVARPDWMFQARLQQGHWTSLVSERKPPLKEEQFWAMKRWHRIFCRTDRKLKISSLLSMKTLWTCLVISRNDEQDVKHETCLTRLNSLEIQIKKF